MRIHFHTSYVASPGLCLIILLMSAPSLASLQQGRQPQPPGAPSEVWWSPPPRGGAERGQVEELRDKRRVYVTFFTFTGGQQAAEIRRQVLRALASYEGVEVVSRVEEADFALHVSASRLPIADPKRAGFEPARSDAPHPHPGEPDWPTTLEVSVLVRGAEQAGGAHRPRVVWQKSQRVWEKAGAASGSGVRAFIKRLKRVRGEK
jgi:hypothetical protein